MVTTALRCLSALALCLLSSALGAQDARPVRIIVPVSAGGDMDATARLLATRLGERLQAPVVVENRPGASTMLATEQVAHAAPDDRTLLMVAASYSINPGLYQLPYNPERDLRPVVQISREQLLLAGRIGLGADSPQQLAGAASAQAGGLNCAAPPGAATLGCAHLRSVLGGNVVSIPYNGVAPALTSLLGSQVDLMFGTPVALVPHVASGKVKLLAAAAGGPTPGPYSGLPRLVDTWPGFVMSGYFGLVMRAGTAPDALARYNQAVNDVLQEPAMRERLQLAGQEPVGGSAADFERFIRQQTADYRRIIDAAGLRAN